jgi:putative SOS response-associated peptidase YedK
MCGRYVLTLPPEAMRAAFRYADQPNFPPRYDIRPTQPVPILRLANGERRFALLRWGFIPGFVKNEKEFPLLINARAETVFDKPSFRNAIRRRRCLFLADGFYEWRKLDEKGKRKQPFLIHRADGAPFGMAGIWESWMSPNGSEIETAAILTVSANALISAIHERMPVIVPDRDIACWLAPESERGAIEAILRPAPEDVLTMAPIARVPPDMPEQA